MPNVNENAGFAAARAAEQAAKIAARRAAEDARQAAQRLGNDGSTDAAQRAADDAFQAIDTTDDAVRIVDAQTQLQADGHALAQVDQAIARFDQGEAGAITEDEYMQIEGGIAYVEAQAHTVVPGDTMWAISEAMGVDPSRYPELAANNPHIADPDLIHPGDVLTPPPAWVIEGVALTGPPTEVMGSVDNTARQGDAARAADAQALAGAQLSLSQMTPEQQNAPIPNANGQTYAERVAFLEQQHAQLWGGAEAAPAAEPPAAEAFDYDGIGPGIGAEAFTPPPITRPTDVPAGVTNGPGVTAADDAPDPHAPAVPADAPDPHAPAVPAAAAGEPAAQATNEALIGELLAGSEPAMVPDGLGGYYTPPGGGNHPASPATFAAALEEVAPDDPRRPVLEALAMEGEGAPTPAVRTALRDVLLAPPEAQEQAIFDALNAGDDSIRHLDVVFAAASAIEHPLAPTLDVVRNAPSQVVRDEMIKVLTGESGHLGNAFKNSLRDAAEGWRLAAEAGQAPAPGDFEAIAHVAALSYPGRDENLNRYAAVGSFGSLSPDVQEALVELMLEHDRDSRRDDVEPGVNQAYAIAQTSGNPNDLTTVALVANWYDFPLVTSGAVGDVPTFAPGP